MIGESGDIMKIFTMITKKNMDEKVSMRERLFRLILFMGNCAMLLAIIIGIMVGQSFTTLLPVVIGAVILIIASIVNYKYGVMELSATLIAIVMNWIVFPVCYVTSGGIESGATVWFVLGIIFVFLVFDGKKLITLVGVTILVYGATYGVSFAHPEMIKPMESQNNVIVDSAIAVYVVSLVIGILIKFQSALYDAEKKRSDKQKRKIEDISNSKNAFFANMSHEIRTPINTIIGLNEMTLREETSEEITENAINIQNASKMLLSLINDILDLSKIESGKMEIVPVQYETGAMFSELVNIIWIRAYEKKIEFKLDIAEDIPSMLYGDEIRIKQVLLNILTNAIKYTQEGSVTFSAKCEKISLNQIRLVMGVTDTGIGIRKEDMKDLFSSFRRVDESENRKIEGTGLGLAISKQLVDLMGGKIEVDSIYARGSTFTVSFLQQVVNKKPIGSVDFMIKKNRHMHEEYKQSFEAPDANVLIVDDNEMNLLVAVKLLRSTKVNIDTASSGAECLEKTKHKYYHIIFMDHKMPDMDGIETLQQLREQKNGMCNNVPVIALTANVMTGAEEIYHQYGFEGYLAKPINGTLFEAMILNFLPKDLIEFSDDDKNELSATVIQTVTRNKKKSVSIATDCVCDLPKEWIQKFGIGIMHYYVHTKSGQFRDVKELNSDNLLHYLEKAENHAYAEEAPEEEYEAFFADALEKADNVIFIKMASRIYQKGEERVNAVAQAFDHVTVVDSGNFSSGLGILALAAAEMAERHETVEHICKELERIKMNVNSSFIVPSLESLYQNDLISGNVAKVCSALELHPVLHAAQSRLKFKGFEIGNMNYAYRKFIKKSFRNTNRIDRRILFVTYAGCTLKQRQDFAKEIEKYIHFENVVFQQASATISCNSGLGAVGVFYLRK